MDDLAPCPFCKGTELTVLELDVNAYAVTCDTCECIGPKPNDQQSQAEARERWNACAINQGAVTQ